MKDVLINRWTDIPRTLVLRNLSFEGVKNGYPFETNSRNRGQLQSGYALLALPPILPAKAGEIPTKRKVGFHLIFPSFCLDNGGHFTFSDRKLNNIA